MRLRIDVGIDAKADRRDLACAFGDALEVLELARGLDVEAEDVQRRAPAQLLVGLADAGEHDLARIAAGRDHARELAAGHDVEAAAQAREDVEHGEVRVGLHRVADEMRQRRERAVELAVGGLERGARIHKAGGAETRRDVGERHALDAELAIPIGERGHSFWSLFSSGAVLVPAAVACRVYPTRWSPGPRRAAGRSAQARLARRKLQRAFDSASGRSRPRPRRR